MIEMIIAIPTKLGQEDILDRWNNKMEFKLTSKVVSKVEKN